MRLFDRRKNQALDQQGGGLTLRTRAGQELRYFPPAIVATFRHTVTERVYRGGLPARVAMLAALRGEGVSYTALAFALTLASDIAVDVCVVELNWWQSELAALVGQPDAPGLATVVAGEATFDEVLIQSDLPNLALLPAGPLPPERRHSIARSGVLREAIAELSQRYDHLIFDLPALLATSDALALVGLANACCVVVRQGVTRTSSVKQALDHVQQLEVLGVILNRSSFAAPRWLLNLIPQG
ncbi:MAG: chromosome partitioning protein [Candidatus Viridilinea halotolerans]|uniref:Chromosome partitioning protein n=1 Tax=Candidatus Viridilinea halotolerans TaxID=2491704 RepID=A0A426TR62_9CHLR|nr:MAG: chromosome partitioning protein [Candidatus Viridilinea halotolerans]